MTEHVGKNVVFFPTQISGGVKEVTPIDHFDDAKKFVVDKFVELSKDASGVIALVISKDGNPDLLMGGKMDVTFLNMFLDIAKDELKAGFMSTVDFTAGGPEDVE